MSIFHPHIMSKKNGVMDTKNTLLRNAFYLGISGIFAKSFDFFFRSYYSTKLGAEGMGLLSLGFGIHGVMLTVATGGIGVAVSKVVSEFLEKGERDAVKRTLKTAVYGVCISSLIGIILTFWKAEWIAGNFLGDSRIAIGLCCLVPSVLFMGISYCAKGYFYAARKVKVPAFSEIIEQLIKGMGISILLLRFLPKGIEYGCMAVFLGITIGELSSCLFLTIFMIRDLSFLSTSRYQGNILYRLMQFSFPAMLSSLITSFFRMQEEVLLVSSLQRFGMSHQGAMSQLGYFHGMVVPMLVFPLTLIGSVTTLIIPEISRLHSLPDKQLLRRSSAKIYRFGSIFGVLVWILFYVFADVLSEKIFHETSIAPMVKQLSWLAPVMFLDSLSCAMLNGMGRQCSLLIYGFLDSAFRLFLTFLFVPRYGMRAMLVVMMGSNILTSFLTIRKVLSLCKCKKHYFWGFAMRKKFPL